ncbi:MAG: aminotransferase class V-fold PLP-dependent enzyme [Ruminococcaceae bacterium]|nr:aminotransferase class V-fold PLP-dependent enzyme [Oscillospiraceae bacterium]
MDTPICDFVKKYAQSGDLRLHMPGHKGKSFLGCEALDITEIDGADVLYHAYGIIKQSEDNAASLFGTAKTIYSTEGSSLAIRGMLYLAMLHGKSIGRKPIIAAGRNAHKTFLTASALLDIEIAWIFPEKQENLLSCEITAKMLDKFLTEAEEKPVAVYITSPDYLGNVADITSLAEVCHNHDTLLLVDNAHGAYLHFLPESRHPIALGADMCCDSAHKTLPVLTGGAYLHISPTAPELFCDQAENAMSLFASTSPSYLIMQSLDAANRYISDGYRERLAVFAEKTTSLKERLTAHGYTLIGSEPLKLTISAKPYGYIGHELSELLLKNNIVCEFCDPDFVVMMLTPEIGNNALELIEKSLLVIAPKAPISDRMPQMANPLKKLTPREALFTQSKTLPIHECIGKVLASPTVSCPPAIPIVVCGEVIDEAAVRIFEYYRIETCNVIE